jgi:glycosyltransferase involved in cell wall biosynthesis
MESQKEHKLRMIMSTNAMWANSGYATIAKTLLPRMVKEGYKVAASNFYGQEGGSFDLYGIKQYPKMQSAWGDDALFHHSRDFKADIAFTNQDIWTMDYQLLKGLNRFVPIVPIDHEPAPPRVVERLRVAYRIITYSKFGRDMLEKEGLYSTYIPCPVETSIFKPLGVEEKKRIRKELAIPEDLFIFGMVSANKDVPPRKSFQEVMDAFVEFKKKVPRSGLYLHTFLSGMGGGFSIDEYAKILGIEKDIFYLQPYDLMFHVDNVKLNEIYNAMDCLVAPSTNEGFGIPIIEAQSAGIPVITNNCTSMPELIKAGTTGYLTEVQWKRITPMLGYVGHPSVESVYNCMMSIYKKDRVKMGEEARRWIIENFDADLVFNRDWVPFLSRMELEIYGK